MVIESGGMDFVEGDRATAQRANILVWTKVLWVETVVRPKVTIEVWLVQRGALEARGTFDLMQVQVGITKLWIALLKIEIANLVEL